MAARTDSMLDGPRCARGDLAAHGVGDPPQPCRSVSPRTLGGQLGLETVGGDRPVRRRPGLAVAGDGEHGFSGTDLRHGVFRVRRGITCAMSDAAPLDDGHRFGRRPVYCRLAQLLPRHGPPSGAGRDGYVGDPLLRAPSSGTSPAIWRVRAYDNVRASGSGQRRVAKDLYRSAKAG